MIARDIVSSASRPRLADYVRLQNDAVRDTWVLQAPERVFVLDESSKAILDLCTGEQTVEAIVNALATEYDAPAGVIEHDVLAVLKLLAEKQFVVIDNDG